MYDMSADLCVVHAAEDLLVGHKEARHVKPGTAFKWSEASIAVIFVMSKEDLLCRRRTSTLAVDVVKKSSI